MAAKRLGFKDIFAPLYEIEAWRAGLLDGTFPVIRFFVQDLLPLVEAHRAGDRFAVARIVRSHSPLLTSQALKGASNPIELLKLAQSGVDILMRLWDGGEPSCGKVLACIAKHELFNVPEGLKPVLDILGAEDLEKSEEAESRDPITDETSSLLKFLEAPFGQVDLYRRYISGLAAFDTHQGVKGLEFDRVMVIMDDSEARGFMFGYEKLLGAQEASATDLKNEKAGKETGVDRTRRLLYVTCSRAERGLALVAYSANPKAVKAHMLKNGWFTEEEIDMSAS